MLNKKKNHLRVQKEKEQKKERKQKCIMWWKDEEENDTVKRNDKTELIIKSITNECLDRMAWKKNGISRVRWKIVAMENKGKKKTIFALMHFFPSVFIYFLVVLPQFENAFFSRQYLVFTYSKNYYKTW